MVKKINSTPLAAPESSGSMEHSANLNFLNTTDPQAAPKMLSIFNYLYKIPLAPVAELSTKDVCIICKGDTDISFPMCETARSRVRLAKCGHILCLGCLSRSAFSSRGNQCPDCQEKLVQDGQGTCCEDEDTVNLVRLVEILKRVGPETAKEALHNIFATSHGACSLDSRKSVIIGAYWVAVVGDVAGRGMDRAKLRTKIRYAITGTAAVLYMGLAFRGLLVLFSNSNYSLAVLILLMYGFGIWLRAVALKIWGFLVQMCCMGLAVCGLLVLCSNGNYSLAVLILLMYGFGICLRAVALKIWGFLVQMCFMGLAICGLLLLCSNGEYSLVVLVLLMYGFGVWLRAVTSKMWRCLV